MDEIKLRVEGIEKSFPGVKALSNISFAVRKGTVHALCGENGAGKSTLMKVLTGLYKADAEIHRWRALINGRRSWDSFLSLLPFPASHIIRRRRRGASETPSLSSGKRTHYSADYSITKFPACRDGFARRRYKK